VGNLWALAARTEDADRLATAALSFRHAERDD